MPLAIHSMVLLTTGRLRELHEKLGAHLAEHGDVLVMVEVGLNGGRDVFIGAKALNLRTDFGSTVVISAEEPPRGP